MKRSMLLLLTLLFLVTIAGAGYLGMRSVRGKDAPDIQIPSTVEVTRGDVQTTVTAPGHLVNTWETLLSIGVGGTLAEVHVRPGETVSAGAELAQVELGPHADQVAAAQVELDVALARLEQIQAEPSMAALAVAQLALASAEAHLMELTVGPSTAELAAAEAEIAAAQRDLEALSTLPDPITLAQAQTLFDQATAALHYAQSAYDAVKDRADVGMLPQAVSLQQATLEHDVAKARLDAARRKASPTPLAAAEARLLAAKAKLAELNAGPTVDELALAELQRDKAEAELSQLTAGASPADVKQAEAAIQAAELALARAEAGLQGATLTAPYDGVILEVWATAGERVAAGSGLVRLADASALEIETMVIEEDLPWVQVGQKVDLFFDAQPEASVQGTVARIVPERLPGDRPLYPVYISVVDLPSGFLSGMTVDASIIVDARHDVLRLPRALVRARSDGTATVQVWTGSSVVECQIETGLRGDAYIEVLAGLNEGGSVVAR